MNEREHAIKTLAQLMQNAARASVAKGAIYDSGEKMVPPEEAWEQAASFVIGLVDGVAAGRKEPGRDVVGQS